MIFHIQDLDGSNKDEFKAETLPTFVSVGPERKTYELEVDSLPGFTEAEDGTITYVDPINTVIPLGTSESGAKIEISGSAIPLATFDSIRAKENKSDAAYEFYNPITNTTYRVNNIKINFAFIRGTIVCNYKITMKTVRT